MESMLRCSEHVPQEAHLGISEDGLYFLEGPTAQQARFYEQKSAVSYYNPPTPTSQMGLTEQEPRRNCQYDTAPAGQDNCCWNLPCPGPQNQNVESLCLCALGDPDVASLLPSGTNRRGMPRGYWTEQTGAESPPRVYTATMDSPTTPLYTTPPKVPL